MRTGAGGGDRAGGTGPAKRFVPLPALQPRDDQTGREGVPGRGAVDRGDPRRGGARDLLASLEQDGALRSQRERGQRRLRRQRLALVPVHHDQVAALDERGRDRPRGRRVQAEELRILGRRGDGFEGDLELAQDRAVDPPRADLGVRARNDDDLVLPGRIDEDQRDARRTPGREVELHARAAKTRKRLICVRILADGADEPHRRSEPRRRHRLIRALPAGKALEPRTRHGLSGARQAVHTGHQVEVDRSDDRQLRRQARLRRRLRCRFQDVRAPPARPSAMTSRRVGSSRRKRAEIVHRVGQQVLAEVEEAGPERRAIRRGAHASGVREALQRANHDRELEVGLRDAHRRRMDSRAAEHRLPRHQLGGAGTAVPRAALGALGLELEQVAVERLLEPGQRRLDPVGGVAESCFPAARGRRLRLAARPPLEQPAERERRRLARRQLEDQPPRRRLLRRVIGEDVGPARAAGAEWSAHTSTMTGRIIGLRRVRS